MTTYKQLPLVTLSQYYIILRGLEDSMTQRIRNHPNYKEDTLRQYEYLMEKLRQESKDIKVE